MNQSVCSDNGSDSKKDNDDDISERTESVLEKKSEKGVGVLATGHCVGAQTYITMERRNKPILLWKEETDLARWIQNCFQSTWACLYGPLQDSGCPYCRFLGKMDISQ